MEYHKYLTFSFDDGVEQDKKIISLMKQYGLKGTFNLNAGLFGKRNWIGRIGNMGFLESDHAKENMFLKKAEQFRIPMDEVRQVYEGFEVASHAYRHENLAKLTAEQLEKTISEDISVLEKVTGRPVEGHAYPFGASSESTVSCLKEHQIHYAREAKCSGTFDLPEDPMHYCPTTWFIGKNKMDLLQKFLSTEAEEKDLLFCMWGHGYEVDYGTKNCSWSVLEELFSMAAGHDDIIYCTNREVFCR